MTLIRIYGRCALRSQYALPRRWSSTITSLSGRDDGQPVQSLQYPDLTPKPEYAPKPYYVTTPIFYVNSSPHIGHAHSMVLADVFKRWQTLKGREAILCTGTDEHGMKVQRAADQAGQEPKIFCDETSQKFRDMASALTLDSPDFIRTTDPHHGKAVQAFWRELARRDLIYESTHKGWYSVSDECFYPEALVERSFEPATGKVIMSAVESGSEVEWVEEKTYHFRMTAFKDRLLQFYKENEDWIVPKVKMAEVTAWVENNLEDLSISRPASRLAWGVPVPDDPDHTIYVWFDALINYISNIGYPNWGEGGAAAAQSLWPADVQIIGKDILRFHGVYWPALLFALDMAPPRRLIAHAHWTMGGKKISKSAGNGVSPFIAVDKFGADTVRFFLMRKGAIKDDGDYENSEVARMYRTELARTYGNLIARMMKTTAWSLEKAVLEEAPKVTADSPPCPIGSDTLRDRVSAEFDALRPDKAIGVIMESIADANRYMTAKEPWSLAKDQGRPAVLADLNATIYTLGETLRIASILLQPIMPERAASALDRLGVHPEYRTFEHAVRGADAQYGVCVEKLPFDGRGRIGTLFPPLDVDEFGDSPDEPAAIERRRLAEEERTNQLLMLDAKESRRRAMKARKRIKMAEKRAAKALGDQAGKIG